MRGPVAMSTDAACLDALPRTVRTSDLDRA